MLKESTLMRSFHFTMDEEGGETYTNDPRDPGGPTKYGVALNYNLGTIPDKDGDGKITALDVRMLEEADALVIYRDRYWRPG
ncbi:glycosyl hydrolase 108 family protein, partial [Desulfovibrio piger]